MVANVFLDCYSDNNYSIPTKRSCCSLIVRIFLFTQQCRVLFLICYQKILLLLLFYNKICTLIHVLLTTYACTHYFALSSSSTTNVHLLIPIYDSNLISQFQSVWFQFQSDPNCNQFDPNCTQSDLNSNQSDSNFNRFDSYLLISIPVNLMPIPIWFQSYAFTTRRMVVAK